MEESRVHPEGLEDISVEEVAEVVGFGFGGVVEGGCEVLKSPAEDVEAGVGICGGVAV